MLSTMRNATKSTEQKQFELYKAVLENNYTKVKKLLDSNPSLDLNFKAMDNWRYKVTNQVSIPHALGDVPFVHFVAMMGDANVLGLLLERAPLLVHVEHDLCINVDKLEPVPDCPRSRVALSATTHWLHPIDGTGSILHNAVMFRLNPRVFELLLDKGANVNAKNKMGISVVSSLLIIPAPYARCTYEQNVGLLKLFIDRGANLDKNDIANLVKYLSAELTPEAVELLDLCIKKNFDFSAAIANLCKVDAWGDIWKDDIKHLAQHLNTLKIIKHLIRNNINPTYQDIQCIAKFLARKHLLDQDIDFIAFLRLTKVLTPSGSEFNWLHFLAANKGPSNEGKLTLITSLIQTGADINAQDEAGRTPLFIAANKGCATTMDGLLLGKYERKVNVNLADNSGVTPLHVATKNSVECVEDLLRLGADVDAVDINGQTIVHYAADQPTLKTVLHHGAEFDKADKSGVTPLMLAAQAGFMANVIALLQAGADVWAKDNQEHSLLDYAKKDWAIVKVFENEMAKQHNYGFKSLIKAAAAGCVVS